MERPNLSGRGFFKWSAHPDEDLEKFVQEYMLWLEWYMAHYNEFVRLFPEDKRS